MNEIWIEKDLEIVLKQKLDKVFQNNTVKANSIFSDYTQARKKTLEIATEINRVETDLTDHSPKHIANVMDNTFKLIKNHLDSLNFAEIYFLCLTIQFHDVGNIDGRKNHQNKIADIYKSIRGNSSEYRPERDRLFKAVAAHCGDNNGDRDTLKKLDESSNLLDSPLRMRELSAVLRFADELAEGPQRTNDYLLEKDKVTAESIIYHAYAKVTNIYIDNNRISISYDIDLNDEDVTKIKLEDLLSYIYTRIIKLDEERRYCKYYTTLLEPYKKTQVSFNITKDGYPIETGIPDIQLNDKFNLNGADDGALLSLLKEYPQLNIETIVETVAKYKMS